MTRAEYLELIEEGLVFPPSGLLAPDPGRILYDHEEVVQALDCAHRDYCRKVAAILGIDRTYEEYGGPEDRPSVGPGAPVLALGQDWVDRMTSKDSPEGPSTTP